MVSTMTRSLKSVLEEGAPPDPFAMTLTSDLTATHIHPLCISIVTQVLYLIPVAALCGPVSTNECICIGGFYIYDRRCSQNPDLVRK